MPIVKKKPSGNTHLVVNELVIRSVDRSRKDVNNWRAALIAAGSVFAPNRSRLYDIYDEILLDGHLSGVITKRIDYVVNKKLYFEKNGERIPQIDTLIASTAFRNMITAIMQTQLWGISGLEFIPGAQFDFRLIPRKHIKPEAGLITFEQNGTEGIVYAGVGNIWVMGNTGDLGLLLKCAPYALYKKGCLGDWAQYIELFGQPVRIIKYDSYDEQTKAELKKIMEESGSSLAMMIPRQADFEMKDGKQSNGDGKLQLLFVKAMNDEMSIIILGNTETSTTSTYSGYAQAKVHMEEQHEITRSDLAYTANMLNSQKFIDILAGYGYPVAGGRFVYDKEMDVQFLSQRLAIDTAIAAQVRIPESYWYDTYGIPRPE